MADICDFTDNDGRVSTANLNAAGTAFARGELTEAELNTLDQANQMGVPVEGCGGSGVGLLLLGTVAVGAVGIAVLGQEDD